MRCHLDARSALKRLTPLFEAELSGDTTVNINPSLSHALEVKAASFVCEQSIDNHSGQQNSKHGKKAKRKSKYAPEEKKAAGRGGAEGGPPFGLKYVTMEVNR